MKAKKLISIFLCILLIAAIGVPAFAAEFSDTEGHWAEHQIDLVADAGIVGGYGDGSFRPNSNITREQFAKVVANFMGYTDKGDVSVFPDVDPNGNLTPYVAMCVKEGVLGGFPDGTMRPKANITREQAAAMLCRALKLHTDGLSTGFADRADITPKLDCEVAALELTGLITGYQDGSFGPKRNLTRGEMMVIISRLLVDADGNFATVQVINDNGTETVTVSMIAYNDYSVKLNVPDKMISADKFTVKTNIEAIPGMENMGGVLGGLLKGVLGERQDEIVTGVTGEYSISELAYNAFRFNFGTVRLDVNGKQCIYNIYGKPVSDGSVDVLATPTNSSAAAAATAQLASLGNISLDMLTRGNSFTLANGSYLQIGTERLCFADSYVGNLVIDGNATPEELSAAVKEALTIKKGCTETDQATLFIKAGTSVVTEKGTITLKKDVTVTLNGILGEYDGTLSAIANADTADFYKLVELANELMNAYNGSVIYVKVTIA